MRIAAIADVHGNRWALEAVLADGERRGIATVVDLGDSVYGPLDPAGTAEILAARGVPSVRGNEDAIVLAPARPGDSPTLRFCRAALAPDHRRWLAAQPASRVIGGEVFCCHGTPASDREYLLESVTEAGAGPRAASEVAALAAGAAGTVVACGHSHRARIVRLPGGRLAVNPGSVGLPAYTDDAPWPHAMEAGSPHARYAVLERAPGGWRVEPVAVEYDWEAAARAAERNGRPDWAGWIRTGRAHAPAAEGS